MAVFIAGLKVMDSKLNREVTFLPYIGSHYSSGGMFRRRVMVLGDSHYGDVPRAEITREVMRWYLDPETEREGWMNTFVMFGQGFQVLIVLVYGHNDFSILRSSGCGCTSDLSWR